MNLRPILSVANVAEVWLTYVAVAIAERVAVFTGLKRHRSIWVDEGLVARISRCKGGVQSPRVRADGFEVF